MIDKILNSTGPVLISLCIILLVVSCNQNKKVTADNPATKNPNVLIILADQWRAQATGYAGDPNVRTPNLDKLAAGSVNFKNAVSSMPVCTPFRASLLTGQRPLTNGVFMNDVQLDTNAVSLGKVFGGAGYDTGYIGKWHLDGRGRLQFIPPGNRRQGFDFWAANECTHNYNESVFYKNDDPSRKIWPDYDAFSQTAAAIDYMDNRKESTNPFLLVLSWGTPHAPYHTAPEEYRKRFDPEKIMLRDNVPEEMRKRAKKDLAGYYAHIAALDDMVGKLMENLRETGELDNTIVLFTSDHGDLLGSQGAYKKQRPYDESIRVPMLYRLPKGMDIASGQRDALIGSADIMPTLLELCNVPVPKTVEGTGYRSYMEGNKKADTVALITCVQPFGQWNKVHDNAREYRGLRTLNYTYTRDLDGPWLLFDNKKDPYQMDNLVDNADYAEIQSKLDHLLKNRLEKNDDEFLPGMEYIKEWGYTVDSTGTVPYTQ